MVAMKKTFNPLLIVLLFLVVGSNLLLYRSPITPYVLPTTPNGAVIGSLIDFSVVVPFLILALTRKKGFAVKRVITWMVIGAVAARFIIPGEYFEPFSFIPYTAIAIEGLLLLAEIGLIVILLCRLPQLITATKQQQFSPLFVFPEVVESKVSKLPIVKIIAAEGMMFYYAFGSWKKKVPEGEGVLTLHKKSSMIAFYVMLIHAIVIETIGFHWWLHEKSWLLSLILLLLNGYTVIYFIADIQVVRLNPLQIRDRKLYVSLGLSKRMVIPFGDISEIEWGRDIEAANLKDKEMIEFIAKDFEEPKPDCILHLKEPLEATLLFGMKRHYSKVALKVDEPQKLRAILEEQ